MQINARLSYLGHTHRQTEELSRMEFGVWAIWALFVNLICTVFVAAIVFYNLSKQVQDVEEGIIIEVREQIDNQFDDLLQEQRTTGLFRQLVELRPQVDLHHAANGVALRIHHPILFDLYRMLDGLSDIEAVIVDGVSLFEEVGMLEDWRIDTPTFPLTRLRTEEYPRNPDSIWLFLSSELVNSLRSSMRPQEVVLRLSGQVPCKLDIEVHTLRQLY